MQPRSTLILAVLFAALGAYLYLVELPRDPDAAANEALVELDSTAVSRIELEHPGRKIVIERRGDAWQMVEPVDAPADQRNVENLIDAVEQVKISRRLDDVDPPATYGLDAPAATIRLDTPDKTVAAVHVGKKAPVGNSAYVQRDGDPSVLLVDASFLQRIDKKASDLRDKRVLVFDESSLRGLTIERPQGTIELSEDEGSWSITAPANYPADQASVRGLVSTLHSMRATDFVDETSDHLERYGLDTPARRVILEIEGAQPIELRVGTELDSVLRVQSSLRPTVYAVPSWVGDSLDRDVSYFRDKTISHFAAEDAAAITIADGDDVLALERKTEGWVDSAGDAAIDSGAVDELVREMASLQGFEIAADEPDTLASFGLDPPERTIRISDRDGVELGAVSVGSHAADGATTEYSAVRPGSRTVFHLREAGYTRLTKPVTAPEDDPKTDSEESD